MRRNTNGVNNGGDCWSKVMSVYKRNGSPFYYMDFVINGMRYKESTEETKKRDAQEVERQYRAEIKERQKRYGVAPVPTYWAASQHYLAIKGKTKQTGRGQSAKGAMARDVAYHTRLVEYFGAETPVDQITLPKVAKYVQSRISSDVGTKAVKASTVKRELNDLKAVLNRAKELCPGYVPPDFPKLKDSDARVRYLSAGEERALFLELPKWLADVVLFAMHTGARKSDILDLRWRDVLRDEAGKVTAVRVPKPKSRNPYRVPTSPAVSKMLEGLDSISEGDHTNVFRASHGGPIADPTRAWETAIIRSGVEDFVFHDLRHTFASRLVLKGVGLKQVSELMGHADIAMTMRYAHLAPSALDDAVKVLG
ncbi:MAG: site-specific integrase [Sneathiella sp.]|uniref:site-specific integrase n=1 Tax=Sneathiella sp. TaxID=1964365 RepID=UPI003002EA42